ncbi:MAG: DUF2508 family protein [Clostridiaceae bacterium]
MNKEFILESLIRKNRKNIEGSLIREIEQAIEDIKAAENMFQSVSDSKLIEIAIYTEQAAIKRLEFLLREAKDNNIKVDSKYTIGRCIDIAE